MLFSSLSVSHDEDFEDDEDFVEEEEEDSEDDEEEDSEEESSGLEEGRQRIMLDSIRSGLKRRR